MSEDDGMFGKVIRVHGAVLLAVIVSWTPYFSFINAGNLASSVVEASSSHFILMSTTG